MGNPGIIVFGGNLRVIHLEVWGQLNLGCVLGLSGNESLPLSEELLERYADKLEFSDFLSDENEVAEKLFNSWTKQEISTAFERIRSVHGKHLPSSITFGKDIIHDSLARIDRYL